MDAIDLIKGKRSNQAFAQSIHQDEADRLSRFFLVEFQGLQQTRQFNDQYPKYILTLDEDPEADYDGIKRINALKWLMGEYSI